MLGKECKGSWFSSQHFTTHSVTLFSLRVFLRSHDTTKHKQEPFAESWYTNDFIGYSTINAPGVYRKKMLFICDMKSAPACPEPIPEYNHSQLCQANLYKNKGRPHYKLQIRHDHQPTSTAGAAVSLLRTLIIITGYLAANPCRQRHLPRSRQTYPTPTPHSPH